MGLSAGTLAKFTSRFDLGAGENGDDGESNVGDEPEVGLGTKLYGELPDEDTDSVALVREIRERE